MARPALPSVLCLLLGALLHVHGVQACAPNCDASSSAAMFAQRLQALANDELGVQEVRDALTNTATAWQARTLNGTAAITDLAGMVSRNLLSIDTELAKLVTSLESGYASGRTIPLPTQCCQVPTNLEFDERFSDRVDFANSCVRLARDLRPNSLPTSARLDIGAGSNFAGAARGALQSHPTLKWLYYGSERGSLVLFPSARSSSCTSYDPRFRPWYTATNTVRKAVILIIDTSGSMSGARILKAIEAARSVVDSLGPNDLVNVVEFNSFASRPSTACFNRAVPANAANLRALDSYISALRAGGGTTYNSGFDVAFSTLANTQGLESHAIVMLFLTDGEPLDRGHPAFISTRQTQLEQRTGKRAVILSFAFGSVATSFLDPISNANGGSVTVVPDSADLRLAMGSYYQLPILARPAQAGDPPFLAVPYFDAFGLGVITTVARRVFHNGVLQGVAAIDVKVEDVLGPLMGVTQGGLSYAFLLDRDLRVLAHPMLPEPSSLGSDPIAVDIGDLETYPAFAAIRTRMALGTAGSQRINGISVNVARGDPAEGFATVADLIGTVYWEPVPSTNLVVGLVLFDGDLQTSQLVAPSPLPATPSLYHRSLDLGDRLAGSGACNGDRLLRTTRLSTVKFAPTAFRSPLAYVEQEETLGAVRALNQYINYEGGVDVWFPPGSAIRADVQATQFVDAVWLNRSSEAALLRYIATPAGLFRKFPGNLDPKDYDPRVRPWYLRAIAEPGLALSAPYEDSSGLGLVVTLSTAINPFGGGSSIGAVLGYDFTLGELNKLLLEANPACATSLHCFLVDSAGVLVFHESFLSGTADASRTQILAPYVNRLAAGFFGTEQCNRIEAQRRESAYTRARSRADGPDRSIVGVPGTNLLLLIVDKASVAFRPLVDLAQTLASTPFNFANQACDRRLRQLPSNGLPVCPVAPPSLTYPVPLASSCSFPTCPDFAEARSEHCLALQRTDCMASAACSFCAVGAFCTSQFDACPAPGAAVPAAGMTSGVPHIDTCDTVQIDGSILSDLTYSYRFLDKNISTWSFKSSSSPGYVFGAAIDPAGDEFVIEQAFEVATGLRATRRRRMASSVTYNNVVTLDSATWQAVITGVPDVAPLQQNLDVVSQEVRLITAGQSPTPTMPLTPTMPPTPTMPHTATPDPSGGAAPRDPDDSTGGGGGGGNGGAIAAGILVPLIVLGAIFAFVYYKRRQSATAAMPSPGAPPTYDELFAMPSLARRTSTSNV